MVVWQADLPIVMVGEKFSMPKLLPITVTDVEPETAPLGLSEAVITGLS
jgi:hypothetical protein